MRARFLRAIFTLALLLVWPPGAHAQDLEVDQLSLWPNPAGEARGVSGCSFGGGEWTPALSLGQALGALGSQQLGLQGKQEPAPSTGSSVGNYVVTGFRPILPGGIDHVLFILCAGAGVG